MQLVRYCGGNVHRCAVSLPPRHPVVADGHGDAGAIIAVFCGVYRLSMAEIDRYYMRLSKQSFIAHYEKAECVPLRCYITVGVTALLLGLTHSRSILASPTIISCSAMIPLDRGPSVPPPNCGSLRATTRAPPWGAPPTLLTISRSPLTRVMLITDHLHRHHLPWWTRRPLTLEGRAAHLPPPHPLLLRRHHRRPLKHRISSWT